MNGKNGNDEGMHAFRGVCQNPDCRHATIVRIHIVGLGTVSVPCAKCGRISKFEWAFAGVRSSLVELTVDEGPEAA